MVSFIYNKHKIIPINLMKENFIRCDTYPAELHKNFNYVLVLKFYCTIYLLQELAIGVLT